ncbi:hypothetical protein ACX1C1_15100 [Paenibacillus sp. strain BS8-2]
MTKQPATKESPSSHVFQIEVMIEDDHHGSALAKLISSLNAGGYADYRILSGVRLGERILERQASSATATPIPIIPESSQSKRPSPTIIAADKAPDKSSAGDGFEQIRSLMKSNKLIRLIVNRGLGIKLSIPCRIINLDEAGQLITVYHVDEKQVYTFRMTELEDFLE